jgi:iron complex transport system permease protein
MPGSGEHNAPPSACSDEVWLLDRSRHAIHPSPNLPRVKKTKVALVYGLLMVGASAALIGSLFAGSVTLGLSEVWQALVHSDQGLAHSVVLDLRLPRALTAFAAGGVLAIAGVLMQVLLRNPLADPFVMGVSGGAAVAALGAMLIGVAGLGIDAAATIGALGTTLLVFALSHGEGGWTSARLLLTGIVVAAGANALVSTLLALGDDTKLRGMLFWLMGDLSLSNGASTLGLLFIVALLASLPFARQLNVLARGELHAHVLGMPVRAVRIAIFVASSLLTAVSVTTAGTIGFVGLVTPHIARLMLGADHRLVLPASAILGGTLVTIADTCARTLFAPRQLPVGALTALVGVPLFLLLMRRASARSG